MFNGAYPGMLWAWAQYNPRFPIQQNFGLRVMSCVASELIQPGNLVQIVPGSSGGTPLVRNARDATALVGIASLDPFRYDPKTWTWAEYTVLPVVRRGRVYCSYTAVDSPGIGQPASFYSGGAMTSDAAGIPVPNGRACFGTAADEYYDNQDATLWGAADTLPCPAPNPVGVSDTLFGAGCALLEMNL